MNKPVKCFIVEGEDRDVRFVNRMAEAFFRGRYEIVTLVLPASENIYMLYQELEENLFEVDLIDLLRDKNEEIKKQLEGIDRQQIDEVFLFFDYDIHENNLSDGRNPLLTLEAMLKFFDNETENGKLYISYPMIEAIYDYKDGMCEAYTECFISVDDLSCYKEKSGNGNPHASRHFGCHNDWRMLLSLFGLKIKCLFDLADITYDYYTNQVNPYSIYLKQRKIMNDKNAVFVLSAFAEFLLDYFRAEFWNSHVTRRKNHYDHCARDSF